MKNNKTALDELSEWIDEINLPIPIEKIQQKIVELRATIEKEIIKEAYAASAAERFHKGSFGRNAEQWYNETYGNDE